MAPDASAERLLSALVAWTTSGEPSKNKRSRIKGCPNTWKWKVHSILSACAEASEPPRCVDELSIRYCDKVLAGQARFIGA